MRDVPVFLSTVTPGKLPTFWLRPVSTLKRELLPLLGLPTNAMVYDCCMDGAKLKTETGLCSFWELGMKEFPDCESLFV